LISSAAGIKLFSDLISVLGKIVSGLNLLTDIPRKDRDELRQKLDETYRLLDTALSMIIMRLGDILLMQTDSEFLQETAKLKNTHEWLQVEREVRLCQSLRRFVKDMESLKGQLAAKLTRSVGQRDWDVLVVQVPLILGLENVLGDYISQEFAQLANAADNASKGRTAESVRNVVTSFREALVAQRRSLIQQELALYS
jgi:hypothetical protein